MEHLELVVITPHQRHKLGPSNPPRLRQEGRQEEAASMTLRQLNRRCGPLSEAITAQIRALPLEQLEALADALLDFQGPDDLATWLTTNT